MDVSNISQDLKRRIKRWSGSGRKLLQVLKGLSSGALLERSLTPEFKDAFIRMDITNRCNMKCNVCYFSLKGFKARGRHMEPGEFQAICEKLSGRVQRFGLSCAFEPLLHPRFTEFLPHLRRLGRCEKVINTNALGLDQGHAEAILGSDLDLINVGLDGASDETNFLVRNNHTFAKVLRNLEGLNELKQRRGVHTPTCQIHVCLLQLNLHDLPEIVRLASSVGVTQVRMRHMVPIQGCGMEDKSCLLVPAQTREVFQRTREVARALSVDVIFPDHSPRPQAELVEDCVEPFRGFYIYPDGRCYPCTYLLDSPPCGDIYQDSLEDIFSSGVMLDLRNKINKKRLSKQCMDCLCDVQNVQQKHERNFEVRFTEGSQGSGP